MEKSIEKSNSAPEYPNIKLDKAIQLFLERSGYEEYEISKLEVENNQEIEFVKINHIAYDRQKTDTDVQLLDFQQLLGALASKTQKFVYVIESSESGVDLYIGTAKEQNGRNFLKDTLEGIFSGSILETTNTSKPNFGNQNIYTKAMLGIPSLKRGSNVEYKQSLEKILFPMKNKSFRITLTAESYTDLTVKNIISNYRILGDKIHTLAKRSKSIQTNTTTTYSNSTTQGTSKSDTDNKNESVSDTLGSTESKTVGDTSTQLKSLFESLFSKDKSFWRTFLFTNSTNSSKTTANTTSKTNTTSTGTSRTNSVSHSETNQYGDSLGYSESITVDEINKSAEYCEKLVDAYIERFQNGLKYGMWNVSAYIQSDDEITLSALEHTLKSVYSGDQTHYEPIRFTSNLQTNDKIDISKLPMLYFDSNDQHPIHNSFSGLSSALNTEELSILSALPNNDIDGVSVSRISGFGLTQSKNNSSKYMEIGKVLNKKTPTNQSFRLSLDGLNSHLFVSGITGGGKSNTIKLILKELQQNGTLDKKIPFLVIEPAKSEYKNLLSEIKELQIFRPGAKNDVFRLNPFFFEHSRKNNSISLTKHVDMLKTTFNSAFPMYGPMPYILEEAIHKIYEDKGWNFETEDNPYFTESKDADYDRKTLLFPNMEELKQAVIDVVDKAGYYQDLQNNIKAALKTRISNMTLGAKGRVFNSRHAFDSKTLFEKPTVIELSNIVDDEEKAFLMGLLLNKLYQYREENIASDNLQHITVIEEAHRLLPNIPLDRSSEEANSRAKAIETFTNILSEIRAYGEGIIVADQIASKLHRDVIKNTNIKIVHRTLDMEDRELIGKSINLTNDQILDIAELKTGEAIVHNRDVHQAFMVQINPISLDLATGEDLTGFNEEFIKKHDRYKYELTEEQYFYSDEYLYLQHRNLNKDVLRKSLFRLIKSAFFCPVTQLQSDWDTFKKKLNFTPKDPNVFVYIAIDIWKSFNYLSNIHYYRNIDAYLDSYRAFLRFILSLNDTDTADIQEEIDSLKASSKHRSVKVIFPSMSQYKDSDIDYTLLLLENITSDEDIYNYVNNTMKEDANLNDRLDKILKKLFQTTNQELRHSLGAIRCGKKDINLLSIIKDGF